MYKLGKYIPLSVSDVIDVSTYAQSLDFILIGHCIELFNKTWDKHYYSDTIISDINEITNLISCVYYIDVINEDKDYDELRHHFQSTHNGVERISVTDVNYWMNH